MTALDNNDFLIEEVLPEINANVENWIDSEFSYIENEEDLEDLEEAELNDELFNDIKNSINNLIKNCKDDYDFNKVNENISDEELRSMIESALDDLKEIKIQEWNDKFEREEYFDDYYSEETEY